MPRRVLRSAVAAAILCSVGHTSLALAQSSAPLVGSVSPSAIGPAAPTAVPLGGLRTVPLQRAAPRTTRARPIPQRLLYPLHVVDAPYSRNVGVVVPAPLSSHPHAAYARSVWVPTSERPRWIIDSAQAPVQAWRDLIVTDVVCNNAGTCLDRQQRMRARWIARCDCYAFADGWNRIWRVE